jgi:hypothetical protein
MSIECLDVWDERFLGFTSLNKIPFCVLETVILKIDPISENKQ